MLEFLLEIYSEEIPAKLHKKIREQTEDKLRQLNLDFQVFTTPCRLVLVSKNLKTELNLANQIIEILQYIKWPKVMHWNNDSYKWIRPIRSILCLLDNHIFDFTFLGIKSDNITFGHKTITDQKQLNIKSIKDYFEQLEANFVIVDHNQRKLLITNNIQNSSDNMDLIEEITGLVEYPNIGKASFDKRFLNTIPHEIIVTTIKHHQKCLVLKDCNDNLSNYFIIVSNVPINNEIKYGHESVINARLNDAEFLYQSDINIFLIDRIKDLNDVIYHKSLGSLKDKIMRMSYIIKILTEQLAFNVEKDKFIKSCILAGLLSKADLTTNIVKEFPELQGLIGYYCFKLNDINITIKKAQELKLGNFDGLNKLDQYAIAQAIRGHYYPQGLYATLDNLITICVALSDKIDTLASFWKINEKPTSSKDPFALRRMCIGMLKILLENNISLDLDLIFQKIVDVDCQDILEFIAKRIDNLLLEQYKYPKALIKSVRHLNNPSKQMKHIQLLQKFYNNSSIIKIENAYKRLNNFLKDKNCSKNIDINKFNQCEMSIYELTNKLNINNLEDINLYDELLQISVLVHEMFDTINISNDINRHNLLAFTINKINKFANFSYMEK